MQHLLADGLAGNLPLLRDGPALCAFLGRLVQLLEMEVMGGPLVVEATPFGPMSGITATLIISESHITIHTWPERRDFNFNFDAFSCRPFNVQTVLDFLVRELRMKRYAYRVLARPLPL